uniref:Uncharacterized protein n=1 Tax=Panagrolaimus sp. ES5 TaxID=591445 RepID=A0AC34F3Z1_9BILA
MDEIDGDDVNQLGGYLNLDVNKTDIKTRIRLFIEKKVYRNFLSPKGRAIIINNRNFIKFGVRHGTEVDEYNIQQLLLDLGYEVRTEHDLSGEDMLRKAKEFAGDKAHKQFDSCIVVVLTHGKKECLCGSDDASVNIHDFQNCFNSVNAPFLKGKPKLFFIQACRGNFHGTDLIEDCDGLKNSKPIEDKKQPILCDMLIAYSTIPNYVSFRNKFNGSIFIRTICEVFSKHAADKNICSLLTMVNKRIAEFYVTSEGEKQMSQFEHSLLKEFYFFPGDDNFLAVHQGPDEVVSQRTMETEVVIKKNGEIQGTTWLVANHWIGGFTGVVQVKVYDKDKNELWNNGWRDFGVNMHSDKIREWTNQIPSEIFLQVHSASVAHKHRSDVK